MMEWVLFLAFLALVSIAFDCHRAGKQRAIMCDYLQEIRNVLREGKRIEPPGDGLLDCYQHWQDHREEILGRKR